MAKELIRSVRAALTEGDGHPGRDLPIEPQADRRGRFAWEVTFQHPKISAYREFTQAKTAEDAVSNVVRRMLPNERRRASQLVGELRQFAKIYATKVH